jgi:5-methylcytosine-specific restriction endonuclease McrA
VLYYHYDLFKSHYDACVNRILHARRHGEEPDDHRPVFATPQALPEAEASDETKREVKARDFHKCLCCGNHKNLQVDHISPRYLHVDHRSANLQTLCKICNGLKGDTEVISFRNHETTLTSALSSFPEFKTPKGKNAKNAAKWEMYLRRCVNFYYSCGAVEKVDIGGRGERFRTWRIWLFQGNDPEWLEPHLAGLVKRIRKTREKEGFQPAPDEIEIIG